MSEPVSRSSERRTRYQAVFGTADADDSPILAPGIAAALQRHQRRVRATASATMLSGVVLFVVASVATNAGADPSRQAAPAPVPVNLMTVNPFVALPTPTETAAAVVATKAVPAKKQAPADPAAISGLAANGIPVVALNAYRVAAARMANVDPGCGIDWALLAGIGREESDHGRFAGAVLHADGTSTPPIIGIPLTGAGTEVVRDTDGGRLDGDPVYDRAVGPMQFIPGTWASYGTDADGDGKANPFDINDAALTAARYLCAAGGDLRTQAGQIRAVLTYNHSDQYLNQVLALADAYRRGVAIDGRPVGNVTGSLPALGTGVVPPANPGAPLGSGPSTSAKPGAKTAHPTPTPTKTHASTPTQGSTPSSPSTSTRTTSPGKTSSPPTSSPTPTPSGTTTRRCILYDLFTPGRCVVYG